MYIVGYGDVGDGKSRPRRSDGRRRAVTNIINDSGPSKIFVRFDPSNDATELEGIGGPGDSGGPALIKKDGNVYLVGVSHASMGGKPGRYGVTDIYTRVSSYLVVPEKAIYSAARREGRGSGLAAIRFRNH